MKFPKRGEIYLVNFEPSFGHEIKKIRPALVIQNDVSNEYSRITIVAAITSQFKNPPRPREVILDGHKTGLLKTSAVVLSQIQSVDIERLGKKLGKADHATMLHINEALKISLGLVEF